MDKQEGTIEITISPETRALMLGARANSVLGDRAFQRILKLDVGNLRTVSTWVGIVADIKELQLHEKQSAHTSGQEGRQRDEGMGIRNSYQDS